MKEVTKNMMSAETANIAILGVGGGLTLVGLIGVITNLKSPEDERRMDVPVLIIGVGLIAIMSSIIISHKL
jgi:hypothetical protein